MMVFGSKIETTAHSLRYSKLARHLPFVLLFTDSSNPSEFQFGGPVPPHGPGYFDFYPPGQGPPPHHNGEGPPPGLVSPFSNSHQPPPPVSIPNMHDGPGMHQQGNRETNGNTCSHLYSQF